MILFSLLWACSDPVQEYSVPKKTDDNWEDWSQKPSTQQGPPVGEAMGSAPKDGIPPEGGKARPDGQGQAPQGNPPEGEKAEGPPLVPPGNAENAASLDSGACRPVASSEMFAPTEGGIALTGTIKKPDGVVGSVLLEFAKSDGAQSQTHYGVVCGFTESYEVEVPVGLTDIYVVAFVDVNGDGPSPEDPRGMIGPLSPNAPADLDEIRVDVDGDVSPLTLPFTPFVNNVPVVNDQAADNLPANTDELPPPTTEVGREREVPDVPSTVDDPQQNDPPTDPAPAEPPLEPAAENPTEPPKGESP